ncbi:dual specificity protein phosphatase 3-like [Mytilus edulis]|uniref:dual specificity protein phosphatase 3-like n=1 Tax=Mytilus edulis TaxID=6550 RepID=UPI0039EEBBF3
MTIFRWHFYISTICLYIIIFLKMASTDEDKFDRQLYHKIRNFLQEGANESIKNDGDEIFPNIYVGNEFLARDPAEVKSNGITHVLNLAMEDVETGKKFYKEIGAKYFEIFAEDDPKFDIKKCFYEACEIIDKALKDGGKILVHCVAGYRRSPTVAIAYMMIKKKYNLWDAIAEARSKRKIFPNDGFIEQLCMLEKELHG